MKPLSRVTSASAHSGLQDSSFPRFAIAGEESAYRVKGDVLHPPLGQSPQKAHFAGGSCVMPLSAAFAR